MTTKKTISRVGLIGLGAMGWGMATNLHQHGLLHSVWNRTQATAQAFVDSMTNESANDAIKIQTPDLAQLPSNVDVIIICVSADDDVRAVIDQLHPHLTTQHIVVDCSTISAITARELAAKLPCSFLDAPVSGGVEGAKHGTLVAMIGGHHETFAKLEPIFAAFTSQAVWMGEVGSGQATKAVNQIMAAGINQAVCEAMQFAELEGLDIAKTVSIVGAGAAGNWFVNHRGVSMTEGNYDTGFKVRLHLKDLIICHAMAAAHSQTLPLAELTMDDYKQLLEEGYGDEDISALYRLIRHNE